MVVARLRRCPKGGWRGGSQWGCSRLGRILAGSFGGDCERIDGGCLRGGGGYGLTSRGIAN